MKSQSAKAKGRRLQQFVAKRLLMAFPSLKEGDIKSTSMGVSGSDITLSPKAQEYIPFDIECKNQERVNIWKAMNQVLSYSKQIPMLVVKRNYRDPLVVLPFEDFVKIISHRAEIGKMVGNPKDD